jgi:hypothetical protein
LLINTHVHDSLTILCDKGWLSDRRVHLFPVTCSAACADDEKRPWVRQEKVQFQACLERNDVVVVEHKYFAEGEPTLLMHFEAIEAMQRGA